MRPATRRLASALGYAVFLFAVVEIALQAFYYATAGDFLFRRTSVAMWAPNEYSGVGNKPDLALEHHTQEFSVRCYNNSQGFRVPRPGVEFTLEKPEGRYRVMLLGASFAYGWGVDYEQTFAAELERDLEARGFAGGRDIEIINVGVPSLGAAPQLRWYEHVGARYRPDLVIQLVYGSMAVVNDPASNVEVTEDGYIVPGRATPAMRVRNQVKKLASVFYAWVLWTQFEARRHPADADREVLGAGRQMTTAAEFDPARDEVADGLAFYRELERIVRENGSELLVVYTPLSYAIHSEDLSRWRHLGVIDVPSQIAFDTAFAQYLNDNGLTVVDTTPALQRASDTGERLYYRVDIHWTARGNEVAANAVGDHLIASGLARPASL